MKLLLTSNGITRYEIEKVAIKTEIMINFYINTI